MRPASRAYLGLGDDMAAASESLAYVLGGALYLNITNACTLSCQFCPKVRDNDWTIGGFDMRLAKNPTAKEVWNAALSVGLQQHSEVVFTGFGESTRRFGVLVELIQRLKRACVKRVRLDTDGLASLREQRDVVPELSRSGLDAISVSLNATDAATYARICPNRYGEAAWHAARDFIRLAVQQLPEVTVSFVGVAELDEAECRSVAESLGAHFRWRPYQQKMEILPIASADLL